MEIKKIVEYSFVHLCMIFVVVVLLKELGIISFTTINFRLFAYILPLFSIPALLSLKEAKEKGIPNVLIILMVIFLFTFAVRLVPYADNPVPLGYDPGIYKYVIEAYTDRLPEIPENSLDEWVRAQHPQGLFLLADALTIFPNLESILLLKLFFPFLGAFLVLPIFILTRRVFDERVAMLSSILYALSYAQFHTFFLLYFKNVIGLILMITSIYLLERNRFAPLLLTYTALGIYHRPTFLLFSLILIPHLIRKRNEVGLTILGTALLLLPFYLPRLELYYGILSGSVTAPGPGTFISFGEYEWLSLAYLPFALIGALYLVIKRRYNSLLFWTVINVPIVFFQIMFYNRYIIPLDLLFVILAGIGLNYSFLESRKVPKNLGIVAILVLCVSSGFILSDKVNLTKPLINENQLETIIWISENTEENAFVLATSYDAPWVLGWSNRKVIAPGMFDWNKQNEKEWMSFFKTKDLIETKEFLDIYQKPIYVYHSNNRGNYIGTEKFANECFEKLQFKDALVYRYLC